MQKQNDVSEVGFRNIFSAGRLPCIKQKFFERIIQLVNACDIDCILISYDSSVILNKISK